MDLGLSGKHAIVTGGSRGVGKEIALSLAEEGAQVTLTYQGQREKADKVVGEIQANGGNAYAVKMDLADSTSIQALFQQATRHVGSVDILINNAGVWPKGYVKNLTLSDWTDAINKNLTSVFLLSQLFVQHCLQHEKRGKVLNITSQAAFHGATTGHAHYAASKSGILGFARSLAREHASDGITINNLALGIVETDMIRSSLQEKEDYYLSRIPLGRVAQPKEIADIATFLVSEKANYLTGSTFDATGGMLMR
ncbi:3-oxoacyl-ACP reductase FabG [Alkalihalobacillus sp. LMS6]|uniref:SDR family NAD(P)-dependent oxidoreductase n=1 Tax=Alkalihalobacillus sp. LMS6 TaxID=2924034 RepID=UPI0020D01A3B|nr:3-oxoacyl-ACP reductase family protein [Alkalihalobacillus sp. LMS6]UTR07554.1 3-oxoacyl-ACP reductase FabG [Alkalihalobacillus sp. LMS6]